MLISPGDPVTYPCRMSSILPDAPRFDAPVYGTIFGDRLVAVQRLAEGDSLILVPDPAAVDHASVWVHATGGDVAGHLAPATNRCPLPPLPNAPPYAATSPPPPPAPPEL